MQVGIHQRRLAPVPARCQPVAFQSRPVQQRRHSCVVRAADGEQKALRIQLPVLFVSECVVCQQVVWMHPHHLHSMSPNAALRPHHVSTQRSIHMACVAYKGGCTRHLRSIMLLWRSVWVLILLILSIRTSNLTGLTPLASQSARNCLILAALSGACFQSSAIRISRLLLLGTPTHICSPFLFLLGCACTDDSELDQRLAALKRAKGATPDNEGVKSKKRAGTATAAAPQAEGRVAGEPAAVSSVGLLAGQQQTLA
jgi:hypothetical protein